MLTNSVDSYGLVSRFLHWVMALLILAMIGVGVYMTLTYTLGISWL